MYTSAETVEVLQPIPLLFTKPCSSLGNLHYSLSFMLPNPQAPRLADRGLNAPLPIC